MFERFNVRARRVLVLAQEEARLLHHNFVGTEHLLLGLVHEGDGVAFEVLNSLGVTLETARPKVEEIVGQLPEPVLGSLPFTPRAKKVLELSLREALQLGHNYIGTEHLLLGLVREGEGVGAQVIIGLGVELYQVRERVMQLLGGQALLSGTPIGPARTFDPTLSIGVARQPSGSPPDCPHCRASLESSVKYHRTRVDDDEGEHLLLVIYCAECGRALAFRPLD